MGVGKYDTSILPNPFQQVNAGPAPPAFNYAGGYDIPAGVSSNPFDQSAINWMYAQKYGQERVGQNNDLYKDYQLKLNNWALNGNRGPMPTAPAYFETDPNKLYNYFNSGQQGILTTNGVMPYDASKGIDPFQHMYTLGSPNNPLYNGSYVYGSAGYNPAYAPATTQFNGPSASQPTPTNTWGMTPEQIAWASGQPQAAQVAAGGRSQVDNLDARTSALMSQGNTGLGDFGANLGPQPVMGPFQASPTSQAPPPTASLASLFSGLGGLPGAPNIYGPSGVGTSGGQNLSFSSVFGPANIPNMSPVAPTQAPAQYTPTANDQFLSGLNQYMQQFQQYAQSPQQANLNTPALEWLNSVVNSGGNPIDQTPAWQAMIDAQKRNIDTQAGNLNEYFNTMGGRFSTSFGNAMNDFYSQTAKDQNALLAAAQTQALESAQQRLMNAGQLRAGFDIQSQTDALQRQAQAMSQLAGYGFQGPALQSQLENQRFLQGQNIGAQQGMQTQSLQAQQDNLLAQLHAQAGMQSVGLGAQASMQQAALQNALEQQARNFGFNASMYNAQAADSAANQLAQNSIFGANNLLNNSTLAAQMLFGNQNNAAGTLFGGQTAGLQGLINQYMQGQGMNLGAAQGLQGLIGQNIWQGLNIAGQQNNTLQGQLNRAYQEWLRTQPQYNPLMQLLAGLSSQQSSMIFPQFQPSMFQQIMGGLGGGGGLASLLKLFGIG